MSVLVVTLGIFVTGYAQEKDPKIQEEVDALKQKLGAGWIIQWNKEGTALNHIEKDMEFALKRKSKIPSLTSKADLQGSRSDIAMNFLRRNTRLFELPTDLHDLHVEQVRYTVSIYQTHNGLPVVSVGNRPNRGLDVMVEPETGIELVSSSYLPHINISTTPLLSEDQVIDIAKEDTLKNHMVAYDKWKGYHPVMIDDHENPFSVQPKPKLIVYVTDQDHPILAYTLDMPVIAKDAYIHMRHVIDANNGAILSAGDPTIHD